MSESVDEQLMAFIDGRLPEGLPAAIIFCTAFSAAMSMAVRHPEWAQAFVLHTGAPRHSEEGLEAEAQILAAIRFDGVSI